MIMGMLKYVDTATGRIVHKHMTTAEYYALKNARTHERLLREDLDKGTLIDRNKRSILAWISFAFFITSVAALKGGNFTLCLVSGCISPIFLLVAGFYQVCVFLKRRRNEQIVAVDKIMDS